MDSHERLTVAGEQAAGADVAAVKRVYEVIARAGVVAGIEELLSSCHEDVEMRAYAVIASARPGPRERDLLCGRDEIRDFFRDRTEEGFSLVLRARRFELEGDTVIVRGSIRVGRPDGSFAEASVSWRFHFRDGLIDRVGWEQRAGD